MNRRLKNFLSLMAAGLLTCAIAQAKSTEKQADCDVQGQDAVALAVVEFNRAGKGARVDLKERFVDVNAKVCLRECEFLEMFACTPDTREHESILVLEAAPSTIHLGLLLLGLEPGNPMTYDKTVDPPKLVHATGPKVEVFVVYTVNENEREVPANRWVRDTKTGQIMEGNTWLFTGSVVSELDGEKMYLADTNGTALSLVNFGDDLLALPNDLTQDNASHGKIWAPRGRAIPKVGTPVKLRLRIPAPEPVEGENPSPAEPE